MLTAKQEFERDLGKPADGDVSRLQTKPISIPTRPLIDISASPSAENTPNISSKLSSPRTPGSPLHIGGKYLDIVCQRFEESSIIMTKEVEKCEKIKNQIEKLILSKKGLSPVSKQKILNNLQLQKGALDRIGVCIEHQKLVTQNAHNPLNQAATGVLNLKPTDPKDIIDQVLIMVDSSIKAKELDVKVDTSVIYNQTKILDDKEKNQFLDAGRLSQVLLNLLSNAIKFTKKGGKINVSMTKDLINENNATLTFSVKDTGIGISEEDQKNIFVPYAQANPEIYAQFGGSGRGLSISKALVELMGGKITVESQKGEGTTFTVTLQTSNKPAEENNASPLLFSNSMGLGGINRKEITIPPIKLSRDFAPLRQGHTRAVSLTV